MDFGWTPRLNYTASDSVVCLRHCALYKFTYLLACLLSYLLTVRFASVTNLGHRESRSVFASDDAAAKNIHCDVQC